MPRQTKWLAHEQTLQALCTLSDVPVQVDIRSLIHRVKEAPDPETAVQAVLSQLALHSEVLSRKWRTAIIAVWSAHHPHVPLLPSLSLASEDVINAPLLRDAHAYLEALLQQPARLVEEHSELLLDTKDVWRLAAQMPSLQGNVIESVESEWSYVPLRRLRAVLHALRLVRNVKGQLVVVRSRYERFRAFPPVQQFYVLWHADAYHVDWAEFGGLWGKYMRVVQDYLPLIWDIGESAEAEQIVDRRQWVVAVLETFAPLWDEEGLLEVGSGRAAILPIVQQHALPTILERSLVYDLMLRHGLVTMSEEFGKLSKFTWTRAGAHVFKAELSQELPCGLELLGEDKGIKAIPDRNERFV